MESGDDGEKALVLDRVLLESVHCLLRLVYGIVNIATNGSCVFQSVLVIVIISGVKMVCFQGFLDHLYSLHTDQLYIHIHIHIYYHWY